MCNCSRNYLNCICYVCLGEHDLGCELVKDRFTLHVEEIKKLPWENIEAHLLYLGFYTDDEGYLEDE